MESEGTKETTKSPRDTGPLSTAATAEEEQWLRAWALDSAVQVLVLGQPLNSSAAFGKSHNLSVPQFSRL